MLCNNVQIFFWSSTIYPTIHHFVLVNLIFPAQVKYYTLVFTDFSIDFKVFLQFLKLPLNSNLPKHLQI